MTPFFADDWLTIYEGDCRAVLSELPADSVDCVVTSPPYFSLRDYGHPGQIGLEATVEEYVETMVGVFREVRRICKPTATVWLNLGDSFLPGKQMAGVPWRVAFALQADGWYLRSDIIWSKPNPMPESVTDRPTKSHEYLFLLTKSARYYFDADAVREAQEPASVARYAYGFNKTGKGLNLPGGASHSKGNGADGGFIDPNPAGRNIRSVWNIATRPYPGAHFAVFPPELPERCIKAGSSERGVCPECGAPWGRVVAREARITAGRREQRDFPGAPARSGKTPGSNTRGFPQYADQTTGWRPTCECNSGVDEDTLPSVVLDPFAGSGTVGLVANRLSRRAILIDLNPEYLKQQMKRNAQTPMGLAG